MFPRAKWLPPKRIISTNPTHKERPPDTCNLPWDQPTRRARLQTLMQKMTTTPVSISLETHLNLMTPVYCSKTTERRLYQIATKVNPAETTFENRPRQQTPTGKKVNLWLRKFPLVLHTTDFISWMSRRRTGSKTWRKSITPHTLSNQRSSRSPLLHPKPLW